MGMELGQEQLNQRPGITKSLQSCDKRFFLTPWGDNSFSPATDGTVAGVKRQSPGKWPLSELKDG